jgi:hypothetical protein
MRRARVFLAMGAVLIGAVAAAAPGWQIAVTTAPVYIQDWKFSARGSNETGFTGGGTIGPSLLWQDCIGADWSSWPSDANLVSWKVAVVAAGIVTADSILAPGVYKENWRSPLERLPPNVGPRDCSAVVGGEGTAEVRAGRTFYVVTAERELYNRFTGERAAEPWLDVIFWDYDGTAKGPTVRTVHLIPIGFVPLPSGRDWSAIDLAALRSAGIVHQLTPTTAAMGTREGPMSVLTRPL